MAVISPNNLNTQAQELIAAATAGSTSEKFVVPEGRHATIFCDALAGVEEVTLEMERPDGTFITVTDGAAFPLTVTSNGTALLSKGVYRVTKTATAGSVGVYAFNISFRASGK
jgi:hypothetical protein